MSITPEDRGQTSNNEPRWDDGEDLGREYEQPSSCKVVPYRQHPDGEEAALLRSNTERFQMFFRAHSAIFF
ncbi:uncharacterized protein AFUA_1G10250 [Aspergillus fumigatus Af293]|uniref:Uncharacterized protein n=2 Tax=Aspergillus fumigatus TaxID=746128 RepID=Q4WT79_ASPFU|nr:hypothetical protein AFUA_1G10250 [Aspergillus fumigatus Af293]EAL90353.1 hypothetical protein AFUA_1G10250 [Aspergillus fumigatus Af293]EDP56258.1 hypothetical protein AFUB_009660 [Aspergillus fumigatus A1163]